MRVVFENVRLPLADFELAADVQLASDVTAFFGPSGSGKTSLLELIAGLHHPASGRIVLNGRILADPAAGIDIPPRHRNVGYVPQDDLLFPHFSVARNISFGQRHDHAEEAVFSLEHVVDVLELRPLLYRSVGRLSGGEKKRVALARALLSSPEILLLDEPLSGLDRKLKDRVVEYLQRTRKEFAIPMVYVTHHQDEVFSLCDEVVVVEAGVIRRKGRPEEIFSDFVGADPALPGYVKALGPAGGRR